jgi:uncharacterized protein with PQ loop repeat
MIKKKKKKKKTSCLSFFFFFNSESAHSTWHWKRKITKITKKKKKKKKTPLGMPELRGITCSLLVLFYKPGAMERKIEPLVQVSLLGKIMGTDRCDMEAKDGNIL